MFLRIQIQMQLRAIFAFWSDLNWNQWHPLYASIHLFTGFEKIARLLIKKGANVNAVNEDKFSALVIAAYRGETIWIYSANFMFNFTAWKVEINDFDVMAQVMRILYACLLKMVRTWMLSIRMEMEHCCKLQWKVFVKMWNLIEKEHLEKDHDSIFRSW